MVKIDHHGPFPWGFGLILGEHVYSSFSPPLLTEPRTVHESDADKLKPLLPQAITVWAFGSLALAWLRLGTASGLLREQIKTLLCRPLYQASILAQDGPQKARKQAILRHFERMTQRTTSCSTRRFTRYTRH